MASASTDTHTDVWRMDNHKEALVDSYQVLTKVPRIVDGTLNNTGKAITSRWSVRNIERGCGMHYQKEYLLDENLGVTGQNSFPVDVTNEALTAVSPKENFKAVIREQRDDKNSVRNYFLEIWDKDGLKYAICLTALDIHGDVYTDAEFGSLAWSHDESKLVYVAEKKIKKSEPYLKRKSAEEKSATGDKKPIPGKEHVHRDDWGEQMTGKIESVIILWRFPEETYCIYDCEPGRCAGQLRFAPNGDCLVGIEWEAKNLGRLGLLYCTNRPGYVFCLNFLGFHLNMSAENKAVRSPRFSPNGDLFWLQREANGPHHACHQLVKLPVTEMQKIYGLVRISSETASVVVDIVERKLEITNGIFYGIYCQQLPNNCFSEDGTRLIFSTQQQNEIRSYVVNTETGKITDISNNIKNPGSSVVLSVRSDVILATFSSLTTPDQLYVAKLPEPDSEKNIEWILVSTPCEVPKTVANAKVQYMTLQQDATDEASTFTAIYFGPDEDKIYPLVVWPHGGPHSAFSNSYSLEAAFFNSVGFAILLINYRGSTGSGDAHVRCLPGNIGDYDVNDCLLALNTLKERERILEDGCVLYGGSHGGFIATHLAGRYSGLFTAMVLRNPVVDLLAKAYDADNPDGCSVEGGWPFVSSCPLEEMKVLQLRRISPIVHAPKVKIPTAVMLGDKDQRVPQNQGMTYARLLKANGTQVIVYKYKDNHSLNSLPVEVDNLINSVDWFINHIKP